MNLQDSMLRRAIFEVYDSKCFYTGDPLDFSNMELDHIIPRSYKEKVIGLKKIIKDCDLPRDFHVDSLINLVP
ncbi:HNH endonuclease, partial [Peribacillus acanthi]|uniref:HNH endonuclease n=1 Tax=Peribacillus acanthi TaxID=2171554 RepID=UPI0023E8D4E7